MTARYFAGIDWSSQKHDLCIQDASGTVHLRMLIPHTAEGRGQLLQTLQRYTGVQVAIERPSGLLVDTLLEAGIPVVPIHPNQLSATRSRYSAARPISDESDAYILSDLLRTDGHRFRVLCSASDETKALRALMRTRDEHPGRSDEDARADLQPAARAPGELLARAPGAVLGTGQRDQPCLPGALSHAPECRTYGREAPAARL
jgi:hypothetical protein